MPKNAIGNEPRSTGIGVVDDMPWGTHFCHFYETKEDLLDILVPYFKTGLENNEFCLWVTSDPLTVAEATRALRQAVPNLDSYSAEQAIEILPYQDWYLEGGVFHPVRVIDGWHKKLHQALANGYAGMRVNGNEAWLKRETWKDFVDYERELNKSIAGQRMIVLCTYPLAKCDAADVLDVARAHEHAITRRHGVWEVIETAESNQAKAEIKQLNEELERRVVERTIQLAAANESLQAEVAERQRTEEALAAHQRTLNGFFDASPAGMAIFDSALRYLQINQTLAEINGLSIQEHLGRTVREVVPKLAPTVEPILRGVFESGQPVLNFEISGEVPSQPGVVRYWVLSYFPIPGPTGSPVAVGAVVVEITQRKRAEEELRESEGLFRELTENIHEVFWISDPKTTRILYVSPAYERVWGRTCQGVYENPMSFVEGIHPDDRESMLKVLREIKTQGNGFQKEYRVVRPDGSVRWIFDRGFPIRNAAGELVRVAGIAEDITERKAAEVALKQADDHLRRVLDTTPALIHTGRPDGYLDYFNQRWLKYTGLSLEDVQGWAWTNVIHPEDVEGIVNRWRASLASGEPFQHEARLRRADGVYRWMLHRKVPLRDEHGNIVKWYGSSTDIEDRKQAEEAMRQSESELAEAQRVARIGSWTFDVAADTIRWSEELYRIFDVEKTVVGGTYETFLSRIHPDDRARVLQVNAEVRSNGKPFEVEYRIKTRSGQLKHIREIGYARKDGAGAVSGLFGTAQDITERKLAEVRLRLMSKRLVEAQEAERRRIARELHDEVGQTLTALKLGLQVSERQTAKAARESVREAERRVDELLARVRTMSLDLRPTMLDDLGLLPALLWHFERFTTNTGMREDFQHSGLENRRFPAEIETAAYRIVQEALTNAARHSGVKEVAVRVLADQTMLRVQVADRGSGFEPEVALAAGTSTGLSGIRERATLLGGEFEIESAPGRGTQLRVSLPVGGHELP